MNTKYLPNPVVLFLLAARTLPFFNVLVLSTLLKMFAAVWTVPPLRAKHRAVVAPDVTQVFIHSLHNHTRRHNAF